MTTGKPSGPNVQFAVLVTLIVIAGFASGFLPFYVALPLVALMCLRSQSQDTRQVGVVAGSAFAWMTVWGAAAFAALVALFSGPVGSPIASGEVLLLFLPAVGLVVLGPIVANFVFRRLWRRV